MEFQKNLLKKINNLSKTVVVLDGRLAAILIIICFFLVLKIDSLTSGKNLFIILDSYGVPHGQIFQDFKAISNGMDVFNTSGRLWNDESISRSIAMFGYPRWWLFMSYLGLNMNSYYNFSIAIIILFLGSVFFLLGHMSSLEGIFVGLTLISPAFIASFDRCNADLIIFSLMAFALMLRRIPIIAVAVVTLAGALKFYPAAGLFPFCKPPWRKTLPCLAAALLLLMLSTLICLPDIQTIGSKWALGNPLFSFGSTPILIEIEKQISHPFRLIYLKIFGSFLVFFIMIISIFMRPTLVIEKYWEKQILSFQIGVSLFVGTFLLGTNFDYRMIMLLFCFPLLFLLRKNNNTTGYLSIVTLFLILSYIYSNLLLGHLTFCYAPSEIGFYLKQLLSWSLVGCLTAMYASILEALYKR